MKKDGLETKIQALYEQILEELKSGSRARVEIDREEFLLYAESLDELLQLEQEGGEGTEHRHKLHQILCILEHSTKLSALFEEPIIQFLQQKQKAGDAESLIYLLAVGRKHIVELCKREGEKVPKDFIDQLRPLLSAGHPELLFWTLKTIENIGNRAFFFLKEEILKNKPGPLALFNSHQKASRQMIEDFEKSLGAFEE